MSFIFNVNKATVTGPTLIYQLKETLKLAGWSVRSSGDGTSYGSSSDIITSGSTGAGGLGNTTAWFRIRMPVANSVTREFTFQRNSSNTAWVIKYSYSAGFSGGSPSATVTPTASDEQTLSTLNLNTDNTYNWAAAADYDGDDGYAFYLATFGKPGASNGRACSGSILFDVMQDGTYAEEDIDPYIIVVTNNISGAFGQAQLNAGSAISKCWLRKGMSGERFDACSAGIVGGGTGILWPSLVGQNIYNLKEQIGPIIWARATSATPSPIGIKGISKIAKWNGVSRLSGDVFNLDGTRDRISFGDINLPWNGSYAKI